MAAPKPAVPNNPKPDATPPSIAFHALLAAALIFIETFSLLSPILLSENLPAYPLA